jgi:hypothetical protein
MATTQSQERWRSKNRYVKKQLNVMARTATHDALDEIAVANRLRGKAEAVALACFVMRGLVQQGDYNPEARRLLALLTEAYHRDRDLHAP